MNYAYTVLVKIYKARRKRRKFKLNVQYETDRNIGLYPNLTGDDNTKPIGLCKIIIGSSLGSMSLGRGPIWRVGEGPTSV